MKLNRRNLLFGGVGIVAFSSLGVWGFGRPTLEAHVASVLRRRLSYLQLDEDGVRAFAHDQVTAMLDKKIPTWNRMKYHFLSAVSPAFKRYYRSDDHRSRSAKSEDSYISLYLLSSDFFINGSDESRPVKYLAFYLPIRACTNPFARPVGAI